VRKNLNRQELAEKLSENNIMTDRSGDILEKIDSDVSEEFLHMCIEYKREDINEQLIEAIAPVTAATLTIKCPFYLGNYKEKAQFVNTYGIKEKDIILHLLRRNMSKSITEEDLSKIIIGEDLRDSRSNKRRAEILRRREKKRIRGYETGSHVGRDL